jgi:hypothetical protein
VRANKAAPSVRRNHGTTDVARAVLSFACVRLPTLSAGSDPLMIKAVDAAGDVGLAAFEPVSLHPAWACARRRGQVLRLPVFDAAHLIAHETAEPGYHAPPGAAAAPRSSFRDREAPVSPYPPGAPGFRRS